MDKETWADSIIKAIKNLGGIAHLSDIYIEVEKIRKNNNLPKVKSLKQTIRSTIQQHAPESNGWLKKHSYFYSVNGLMVGADGVNIQGNGEWGLIEQFEHYDNHIAYLTGLEGVRKEAIYLRKTRNQALVAAVKKRDNNTCQSCGFYVKLPSGNFIIDVHHLNPLKTVRESIVTSVDDLICLCPNCHRIAHSRDIKPLNIEEIKAYITQN